MCNSPQRVYILHGIQHHCVWTVGWLGVVACLACITAAVDKQAHQSSCLVWWCELSRSDRLTSISVFCVGVRLMVAPAVPVPPDTLWYWMHLSGGWVDSVYAATPDMTRWSCLCRFWCADVNWTIAVNVFRLQIFCQRHSWVVGNPIHTSEVDATQTRQFCHVWHGCVN